MGGAFGSALKVGALAAVGGALLAGKFLKGAIDEAREAQVVTARTENVIQKMGNAAGISAKQVAALAGSISAKTGIDDEAIQSGQNLLLTFGNIRNEAGKGNDIFSQTSQLMVDMSAAMGTDAKSSAIQLGKALNDPVKGITALTRVGVAFTEKQKATIASLVESGDVMGAQKVILKELGKEFGGAAAAMATPADKAKVAYDNLKEQIGTALLPVLDGLLTKFTSFAPAISKMVDGIGPAFGKVKAFLAPLSGAIQSLFGSGGSGTSAIGSFVAWLKSSFVPAFMGIVSSIRGFIAVALPIVQEFVAGMQARLAPMVPKVLQVFEQIKSTVLTAMAFISQVIKTATTVIQFIWSNFGETIMGYVSRTFSAVVTIISGALNVIQGIFRLVTSLLKGDWSGAWDAIKQIVKGAWQIIKGIVSQGINIIRTVLEVAWTVIKAGASAAWNGIKSAISSAINGAKAIVATNIAAIKAAFNGIADLVGKVRGWFGDILAAIKGKLGEAVAFIKTIPGKATAALGDLGSVLLDAGRALIQGLIDGIQDKIGDLKSKLSEITSLIPDIKGPPEKDAVLLRPAGQLIMKGLIDGLNDGIEPMSKKLSEVTQKIRDGLKSAIDQIKSDMASLSDSIAGAFTGNLFEATTGAGLVSSLMGTAFNLEALKKAFKKLVGMGVSPAFLSQMFASGNSALILDLAAGPRWQAQQASALFDTVGSLSSQLGGQVASNQYGPHLSRLEGELKGLRKDVRGLAREFGREISSAVSHGQRRAA